jgi:hypothetical protein
MNPYRPRPSRSRGLAERMERRPLTARLLLMVVAFLFLIPIAGIIRGTGTNVVKTGGLPGAAVAADPLLTATTTPAAGTRSTAASSGAALSAPATSEAPPTGATSQQADLSTQATSPAAATTPTTAAKKTATTPASAVAKKPASTAPPATTAKKTPATTTATPKATTPPTTKAPAATAPPSTRAAATTTSAPAAPPANIYSKSDVETIIREIWPADLADKAVHIATRESKLVPTVRNWCCFGLFQIYFETNKTTLAGLGITSAEQLYDPRVNATAAYAMYQRAGWTPWS